VETFDIAKTYFKREGERDKEDWKRTRWLAYWIVNMMGKYAKKEIKETELGIKFDDEIKSDEAEKISPEERRRQAIEGALFHMKHFPKLIKKGKDGGPKIYGEN